MSTELEPGDPNGRTIDDVEADLGEVFVDTIRQTRKIGTLLRVLAVPILCDLALSLGLGWVIVRQYHDTVRFHHEQIRTCLRFNESRAGELALWTPLLRAPRAPLPENATADQRKAYDEATAARNTFEANLHKNFDPIKC